MPSFVKKMKPLLIRELWSQSHRRYAKHNWSYPGPIAWLVVSLVPLFWHVRFGQRYNADDELTGVFSVTSAMVVFLMAYRASLHNAVASAHAFRQNTVAVNRTTPYAGWGAQAAKLIACLLPLWFEVGANLLFQLGVFSLYGKVPVLTVLGLNLFLFAVTVTFGCLGMWLGMLVPDVARAARTSSAVVFIILFGSWLLELLNAQWALLLTGAMIWTLFKISSKQTTPVLISFMLILPMMYLMVQDLPYEFKLSAYNPVIAARALGNSVPAEHLLGPEYERGQVEGLLPQSAIESLAASVTPEEARSRALFHLLPVSCIYLFLAFLLFGWTHTRWRSSY